MAMSRPTPFQMSPLSKSQTKSSSVSFHVSASTLSPSKSDSSLVSEQGTPTSPPGSAVDTWQDYSVLKTEAGPCALSAPPSFVTPGARQHFVHAPMAQHSTERGRFPPHPTGNGDDRVEMAPVPPLIPSVESIVEGVATQVASARLAELSNNSSSSNNNNGKPHSVVNNFNSSPGNGNALSRSSSTLPIDCFPGSGASSATNSSAPSPMLSHNKISTSPPRMTRRLSTSSVVIPHAVSPMSSPALALSVSLSRTSLNSTSNSPAPRSPAMNSIGSKRSIDDFEYSSGSDGEGSVSEYLYQGSHAPKRSRTDAGADCSPEVGSASPGALPPHLSLGAAAFQPVQLLEAFDAFEVDMTSPIAAMGVKPISPETALAALTSVKIKGEAGANGMIRKIILIDARYGYEHSAGGLQGAKFGGTEPMLFEWAFSRETLSSIDGSSTAIFVYCEDGQKRGCEMASALRGGDRELVNRGGSGALKWPHIYVIDGGFARVVETLATCPEFACHVRGRYVKMNDEAFKEQKNRAKERRLNESYESDQRRGEAASFFSSLTRPGYAGLGYPPPLGGPIHTRPRRASAPGHHHHREPPHYLRRRSSVGAHSYGRPSSAFSPRSSEVRGYRGSPRATISAPTSPLAFSTTPSRGSRFLSGPEDEDMIELQLPE